MRAAWYEERGAAADVLVVGEVEDPEPGPGEVRIALEVSGINPGDVKKRSGWQGSPMAFPRIIPHSDGAGRIDRVGPGVDPGRLDQPVWCYGAQSYRPFGTAADYVVVPSELAVALPPATESLTDRELAEQAACLGIAGITGHRAVFADGSVKGLTVLVHGAVGGVGSIATQMAVRGGATVIAGVRDGQQDQARQLGAHHVVVSAGSPQRANSVITPSSLISPHFDKFPLANGKMARLAYTARLMNEWAEATMGPEVVQVVVKFTRSYCAEAHALLADAALTKGM